MQIGALDGTDTTLGEAKHRLPKPKDIFTVKSDAVFVDIMRLFLENGLRQILVMDDNKQVLGIIARRDILKAYIDLEGQT